MFNQQRCKVLVFVFFIIFICILNKKAKSQISLEQRNDLHSIKTLRIVVDQSYNNIVDFKLPFKDVSCRLMEYCGLT